jgi:hypothetical protein
MSYFKILKITRAHTKLPPQKRIILLDCPFKGTVPRDFRLPFFS